MKVIDVNKWTGYAELPLELVARHEAGHAVMAHLHGGFVRRILLGHHRNGVPFGRAFFVVYDEEAFIDVLSAGVHAMFLGTRPSDISFAAFESWLRTPDGESQVVSGASDWQQILQRTGQSSGYGLDDFLMRAVRPYFDQAVARLAGASDVIDRLTLLLLSSSVGIGQSEARRFFAGKESSLVTTLVDRPSVLVSSFFEKLNS